MKLIELRLQNFRQFEGEHVLKIAPDGPRNVTVVYGANGSGKTTLLNSFTWCLYEELTQDFMYHDRLISDGIWNGLPLNTEATARVEIEFEHQGENYTLTRSARATKIAQDAHQKPIVEGRLVRRSSVGAVAIDNPRDFVDTVLPDRLHHFFFLNGERFEHLLSASAYDDIESAIKTILGIEIIERGIGHLVETEKRLTTAYKRLGSGEEARVADRLATSKERQVEMVAEQKELTLTESQVDEEITVLDQRLRDLDGSKQLQEQRDTLSSQFEQVNSRLTAQRDRRTDVLAEYGFLAFVTVPAEKAIAHYDDMRVKREIPKGIKVPFVEDLLEHGTCICGTDISTPGEARTHLESWRKRAGQPEVEESWMSFWAHLKDWNSDRLPVMQSNLDDLNNELANLFAQRNTVDQKLSEVSKKLGNADEENIRSLEESRKISKTRRDQILRRKFDLESRLKTVEAEVRAAESELRQAHAASKASEIAQRRILAAEDVRSALEKMRALRTDEVRRDLDGRIKRVYGRVVKKRQIPTLSKSFKLLIEERVGDSLVPKAMSTGEAQVLTLSFVGGLASLAQETFDESQKSKSNPLANAAGGIFPFVADAIFGTLDESFRQEVTRLLPELAPQVVLFLSKAQSAGAVQEELEPRVGAVAVINAEMARKDVEPEAFNYDGRKYPYVSLSDSESDRSSLVTIKTPKES